MPWATICERSVSLSETAPPLEPIGTRDIDSTRAETTTSSWPAATAAAALKFPCIDEPHCRSTVVPQTDSGQPATSGAIRPMFQPCSPTCETQPIWMSSISAGSSSWRPTSPFSTCPARSSARIFESDPFRLPIGERTASTISASRIYDSVQAPFARNAFQLEQVAPRAVAELRRPLRRPDDVGEEHGGKDAVRHVGRRLAGHEALDLVRNLRRQLHVEHLVPGDPQCPGARDPPSHVYRMRF